MCVRLHTTVNCEGVCIVTVALVFLFCMCVIHVADVDASDVSLSISTCSLAWVTGVLPFILIVWKTVYKWVTGKAWDVAPEGTETEWATAVEVG